jgi:putative sterol carrier protein
MATLAEIFERMPQQFNAEKAGDMNATVQFDLSGDDRGQWYVVIADGAAAVEEGTADNATATLKMVASDYKDMIGGKLNPMAAFMSGKVKVEGDLNTIMKFQSVFGM